MMFQYSQSYNSERSSGSGVHTAPATPRRLQTSERRDVWAPFAPSSQKPGNGRRESLTGCNHPTSTSQSAETSSTMLLLSFSNLKDLIRTSAELSRGWTSPRGQCYPEEQSIQRCWFHNRVQMFPDTRIVTQTRGPHVLPPIHGST